MMDSTTLFPQSQEGQGQPVSKAVRPTASCAADPRALAGGNRLHWRRDVTLGEDRSGMRFPPVAQMLSVLNTVVLSLMDMHQVKNVARQIRRFVSHPHEALAWVL